MVVTLLAVHVARVFRKTELCNYIKYFINRKIYRNSKHNKKTSSYFLKFLVQTFHVISEVSVLLPCDSSDDY
jgi:hypothetical protein